MRKILLFISISLIFIGCETNKPKEPNSDGRNVLAYIVGDNNLASFAFNDINEMEMAWRDDINGKLYVFYNKRGGESVLYEIKHDNDMKKINSNVIETFSSSIDPCDPGFFRKIVDKVDNLYKVNKRGLILWSHGSGWLPFGSRYPYRSSQSDEKLTRLDYLGGTQNEGMDKTIGSSDKFNSEMEIYDVNSALDGLKFDFISFDACYMAGIEVYYQLRNRADYIFASAAETLADGAPYHQITPMMFESSVDIKKMAQTCFDFYNNQSGVRQSSTYSVVKCDKLEALAKAVKEMISTKVYTSDGVQQFGRAPFNNVLFDLTDFLSKNYGDISTYTPYLTALNEAVVFEAATAWLFNQIKVDHHCGLTCYIPKATQPNTLKVYLERYDWSKDSGLGANLAQ